MQVRNELEVTKQLLSQAQHDLEVAENKVKTLERSLAEREAYVEQLEGDLTTHQTLLQRAQEESERELSTLRARLTSAETAAADAQHDLERVKSSAERRRADGEEEAARLQSVLAEKEAALERATSTADRLQREMAETTRGQQETHHKTQLALSEELAQLTLQLQQRDVQLRAGKAQWELWVLACMLPLYASASVEEHVSSHAHPVNCSGGREGHAAARATNQSGGG